MNLRELSLALLDLSSYGIHSKDEVLVEGEDGEVHVVTGAEHDFSGDRDIIRLTVGGQR